MHLAKYAGDDALYDFDCTNLLADDETITAVGDFSALPTFAALDPALLVFTDPVVNVEAITYPDGRVMAPGKGFQVRISGGESASSTAKRVYSIAATFTTSDGNTLTTRAPLWLLPPAYPAY